MNNEVFIMIPNYILDKDMENKCEHIYLYAMLRADYSNYKGYTKTTIAILAHDNILSKDSNNRRKANKIKKLLISLHEQGFIQLNYDGELKPDTLLKISFPNIVGFEQVTPVLSAQAETPEEFVVLVTVKRFDKEKLNPFERAKDKWGDYLGCSENTGIKVINKLIESGKIYCVVGEKYRDDNGEFGQNPTKWYLSKQIHQLLAAEMEEETPITKAESKEFCLNGNQTFTAPKNPAPVAETKEEAKQEQLEQQTITVYAKLPDKVKVRLAEIQRNRQEEQVRLEKEKQEVENMSDEVFVANMLNRYNSIKIKSAV